MSLYNPSLGAPLTTNTNPMHGFIGGTPYHGATINRAHLAAQYERNRHYVKQNNPTINCDKGFCHDTHEAAYCCDHLDCTMHPGKTCKK